MKCRFSTATTTERMRMVRSVRFSVRRRRCGCGPAPGEWQAYDIVFEAPRFESSKLISPAYATVFLNGVLIHHRRAFAGETVPTPNPVYAAGLTRGPLAIQEHGDLTGKVRFRNIWVRPLGSDDGR